MHVAHHNTTGFINQRKRHWLKVRTICSGCGGPHTEPPTCCLTLRHLFQLFPGGAPKTAEEAQQVRLAHGA
jgi:hypothetical protein